LTKIKTIVLDLDDTLYSCFEQRFKPAMKYAFEKLVASGLSCTVEDCLERLDSILKNNPSDKVFRDLVKTYSGDEKLVQIGQDAYLEYESEFLVLFPDVLDTLRKLHQHYSLALVTFGNKETQEKKIELLGLKDKFDHVVITQNADKEEAFLEVIDELGIKQNRTLCVGDRIDSEIKIANKLGMTTVRMLHGRHAHLEPTTDFEYADYSINTVSELLAVLDDIKFTEDKLSKGPRIVVIGGGTGLPTLLEGLKKYSHNLAAIVTITDEGRHSGRLRRELGILPPGDIRNNLIALSDSEKLMHDLFQYRFDEGSLEGVSFGNLFLAALTKITGNFQSAIRETSKILDLKGSVYPSTLDDTRICVELVDGTKLEGEVNIIVKGDKTKNYIPVRIKNTYILPENAKANEAAIEQIRTADIIVIGPGSLHTSVMPNLLIPEMAKAIRESKAKRVYVCNIVTQPGQSDGYKASDHLAVVEKHLGKDSIDYLILNKEIPSEKLISQYKEDNSFVVENDVDFIKENFKAKVLVEDILEDLKEKKLLWEKLYLLRHDSNKIAEIVASLVINGNS